MTILKNTGGLAATNSYLIADDATRQAVLFDAPDHTVVPLLNEARKRNLHVIGLWLTHGHFDHVADHPEVATRFPEAKVLIHRLDEPKLRQPNSSSFQLPFKIVPRGADGFLEDGQELRIGGLKLMVIHTPGHSPGHVMFHFPEQKILVGGDLIIMGAVGRTDLPDSSPAELDVSIRKIMQLPDDTRLLPGHGHESTLGEERNSNPYVKAALNAGRARSH
ncbi:MAG TPA: MBL fold metallo-hydrolase [Tepidisphaeraceae bacterium]|nr:MBL fold metallo-hydrolase [Tepidisphaeraceae bacterium]